MLLLFDIDQTLIQVRHGIGRRVVAEAFATVYGTDPTSALVGYSFGGRTDRSIVHDLAQALGIEAHVAEAGWDRYRTELERHMLRDIRPDTIDALPGVVELIDRLQAHTDHTLALVTGNIERIAHHKLGTAGLGHIFRHGAYGCEHVNRSELPPRALQRVNDALGTTFVAADCLVIGDAPNDVVCALDNGMQVLCVATGGHEAEDLRRAVARTVLPSFANVQHALDAIASFS
jgi:phosphoglycolate phosphatase